MSTNIRANPVYTKFPNANIFFWILYYFENILYMCMKKTPSHANTFFFIIHVSIPSFCNFLEIP